MAFIKPTIGRVVWYWPPVPEGQTQTDQPYDAHVAYVWNDRMINIGGFDHDGVPYSMTSVPLIQDGDPIPENGFFCTWMPYQQHKAATEPKEPVIVAGGKFAPDPAA